MKRKVIAIGIISMFLLVGFSQASTLKQDIKIGEKAEFPFNILPTVVNTGGYTPHDDIDIRKNEDFTEENGVMNPNAEGTIDDPYIIEGWEVFHISISSTDVYFIVRNCYLYGRVACFLGWLQNGTIQDCTFQTDSVGLGVHSSKYCVIENCSFFDCSFAISMNYGAADNEICYNTFFKCMGVFDFTADIEHSIRYNRFHHNEILYIRGVYSINPDNSVGMNYWDDGTEGNYWWVLYQGVDENNDGIGDTPCTIIDGSNIDNYPLMNPVKYPCAPTITGPSSGNTGTEHEFTISSIDPLGEDIDCYLVNWGDDERHVIDGPFISSEEVTINHTWTERGENNIQVSAVKNDVWGPLSTLTIKIIKSKTSEHYHYTLLTRLIDKIGIYFPPLQHLLNLLASQQ